MVLWRSQARLLGGLLLVWFCLAGCGYRVAGRADLVPKSVHTVAIPAFSNATVRYKLSDRLPQAISQEFIARTRYQVITDAQQADAVLRGSVINYLVFPILFDQATGRASGLQINVTLQVSFIERATGKVIFTRPNFEVHQRYEIAVLNDKAYLEEDDAAIDRLSRDVARDLVSSILENF